MVMHARKPQRISDGYFEKHQTHPYQKYNAKRATNDYVASESRYSPLRSPNGNMSGHSHRDGHSSHGHHHYTHCTEERAYSSRNSYTHKGSEKERDRDYKSSRNESARSPKEKRYKDSDRSNHERERSNHERSENEKKSRTSNLNLSVSRSNKYEKRNAAPVSTAPGSEWSEHISSSGKKYYYNSVSEVSQWEKPREWDSRRTTSKETTYTSKSNHDKRTSSRSTRDSDKSTKRSDRYWNSNSGRDGDAHDRTRSKHYEDGQSLQDMDISPDRSTPLSENSYRAREAPPQSTATSATNNNATTGVPEHNSVPPVVVLDNSNQPSGSLLAAALPRIVATPVVSQANNGAGGSSPCETANSVSSGTPHRDQGPPTPTHSESVDPHAPPIHLDTALPRKMESLGSYSSVVGGNLQHAAPMLTPSLINYMRTELTTHVSGWPADLLEKQANKFTDEAYQLGCMQCTRVSAELKCTRSLVRHTEIQATLQEQKIMYLRQQISRLEELKSQNSFMSED